LETEKNENRLKERMTMKELILFYSLAGATRRYAEVRAKEDGADLHEIKETSPHNGFTAWIPGVLQAMGQSKSAIEPIGLDLNAYDKIVLAGPIWAGNVAPAINGAAALLPKTAKVELVLVSGSGNDYGKKLAGAIRANGCEVTEVVNIGATKK
jgi:flavodoxin